jgi:hypothetical protein
VLVLCGCGGGNEPEVTAQETPAAELAPPQITAPENGSSVDAGGGSGNQLTAKVKVTGTAAPSTRMVASSGCAEDGCTVRKATGIDGTFEAEVVVIADSEEPRGTIVLGYDNNASLETDRVIVTIIRDASDDLPTSAPKKNKKAKGRKPSRTPRPQRTATAPPSATSPPSSSQPAPTAVPQTSTSARNLIVIGDSLAVGIKPYLPSLLPGWSVSVDARIGRPLAEGMSRLSATSAPSAQTVYAFSLGTNDDPSAVSALAGAVQRSTSRGCVVWATIARPPYNGVSYAAMNSRLKSLASSGRVMIVPWAEQAAAHPEWMAGDGVHATPAGYRQRAQMYANAVKQCG